MSRLLETAAVRFLGRVAPSELLMSDLMEVYERDPNHKFNEGDVLVASQFDESGDVYWSGYAGRPVFLVKGYEKDIEAEDGIYYYRVDYYWDGIDPETGQYTRKTEEQLRDKWNIENHFRKYPAGALPEQAVDVYSVNLPGVQATV